MVFPPTLLAGQPPAVFSSVLVEVDGAQNGSCRSTPCLRSTGSTDSTVSRAAVSVRESCCIFHRCAESVTHFLAKLDLSRKFDRVLEFADH